MILLHRSTSGSIYSSWPTTWRRRWLREICDAIARRSLKYSCKLASWLPRRRYSYRLLATAHPSTLPACYYDREDDRTYRCLPSAACRSGRQLGRSAWTIGARCGHEYGGQDNLHQDG